MRSTVLLFTAIGLAALVEWSPAADPAADTKILKNANVGSDGPSLLEYFRKRTLTDSERDRILGLIQKMGDDSFAVREQACLELVGVGTMATPLLRQATKHPDIEVVRRAERCLEILDKTPSSTISSAAARQLGRTKPAGAADILLAYLPFADDDSVVEDVRATLTAVAVRDGQVERPLIEALEDKLPLKRGVAAEAIIRGGRPEDRDAARRLLHDPDAVVRLWVALALIDAREKEGIPALVPLLTELPLTEAWQAEETLYRLAGDQAPNATLSSDPNERKKCSDAWAGWWRDHAGKIDLTKFDPIQRQLGYTLIVQMDNGKITGRVMEIDRDGKPRWQIENLNYPIDAQVLPGNRVLIAEYRSSLVSERTFKGEILWQRQIANPVACQRLANGHTFIASRNQLIEVDRNGKDVSTYNRPNFDIMTARKLRDGQTVFMSSAGQCVRLDAGNKEVKSFPIGPVQMFSGMDVVPGGRLLVPQVNGNKVTEYDLDGKQLWSVAVQYPTAASRLPNGNTLVACMSNQQIIEFDKTGKQVWAHKLNGRPWRAARR